MLLHPSYRFQSTYSTAQLELQLYCKHALEYNPYFPCESPGQDIRWSEPPLFSTPSPPRINTSLPRRRFSMSSSLSISKSQKALPPLDRPVQPATPRRLLQLLDQIRVMARITLRRHQSSGKGILHPSQNPTSALPCLASPRSHYITDQSRTQMAQGERAVGS